MHAPHPGVGFGYGILATLTMSFFMMLATMMQVSPMPAPVPIALAKSVAGGLPQQAIMLLGMVAHFLYGGMAGALFARIAGTRADVWRGLGWGALLWLVMQVVVLPLLGWGLFGTAVTGRIWIATLMLHLIYGGILGGGLAWHRRRVHAPERR